MGYSEEELARIEETGSNNISRATPEWLEVLKQAVEEHVKCEEIYSLNCRHELHHAYRLVNEQVVQGILWNKCANCGSPYRLDREDAGGTVCSPDCHNEYAASLMEDW